MIFFSPFLSDVSIYFITWRYDFIAGQDRGESAEDAHQEEEEHLEGREKRGRGGDAGANSDTGVLSEASQLLLITWNKVGKICTKFKLQTSFSGLEYF